MSEFQSESREARPRTGSSPPAISVLMSVRNGIPYVGEAIASILAQTFTGWEFIIVDNASNDGSVDVLKRFAQQEPRIRLLFNASDLGASGALNRGLELCSGCWVARMDADDVAMPNRFERQLEFLRANPEVQVSSCLAFYINHEGAIVGKTFHDLKSREDFDRYVAQRQPIAILHPGAMVRRELVARSGGYRGQYEPASDVDLWARLVETGAVILVQQEYLMKYRVHSGSVTSQSLQHARLKYLWVKESMRARRMGQPEPTWERFLAARSEAPWWIRANRWRKDRARILYRHSAQDYISGRRIRALFEICGAALLQPNYTIPRLKGQRY